MNDKEKTFQCCTRNCGKTITIVIAPFPNRELTKERAKEKGWEAFLSCGWGFRCPDHKSK